MRTAASGAHLAAQAARPLARAAQIALRERRPRQGLGETVRLRPCTIFRVRNDQLASRARADGLAARQAYLGELSQSGSRAACRLQPHRRTHKGDPMKLVALITGMTLPLIAFGCGGPGNEPTEVAGQDLT